VEEGIMGSQEPSLAEQRRELVEAIRVNEGLLCEQQAYLSLHDGRVEAIEWQFEELRQSLARQHKRFEEAPGRIALIQAKLSEQRLALEALKVEQDRVEAKVSQRQLCELLARLLASPSTLDKGRELLKGMNQGVEYKQLWGKYS
jgi:hypothetical protein